MTKRELLVTNSHDWYLIVPTAADVQLNKRTSPFAARIKDVDPTLLTVLIEDEAGLGYVYSFDSVERMILPFMEGCQIDSVSIETTYLPDFLEKRVDEASCYRIIDGVLVMICR